MALAKKKKITIGVPLNTVGFMQVVDKQEESKSIKDKEVIVVNDTQSQENPQLTQQEVNEKVAKILGHQWIPMDKLITEDLKAMGDIVITIDTRDFHYTIQRKSFGLEPRKIRTIPDVKSEFLTIEQVIARLEEWKQKGFSWKQGNGYSMSFKYIRIHSTKRGYLWCNSDNQSFPAVVLDRVIIFPTKVEIPTELVKKAKVVRRKKVVE